MVERRAKAIPQRWNYEFRDPSADIEQMFDNQVPVVSVHKRNLWGIQTLQEYERAKRKRLESDMKKGSLEFVKLLLSTHPVHAVAIPMDLYEFSAWGELEPNEKYLLTVLDGHHRIRFSPKEIREIPTMIFTIEQAFATYRRRYKGTIEQFVTQIVAERGEALNSFTRVSDRFLPAAVYISKPADGPWRVSERMV